MPDAREDAPRPAHPTTASGMGTGGKKPLMRALGEFVGHIAKGITTDPSKPTATRQKVRERVEEETRETPEGKVILRRTTIEEIEVRRDEGGPAARGG